MSGWARSGRSRYRSASPATLDDSPHNIHIKASKSTSKRLERGINLLEEALAKCDTDDAYKSTLELYASHFQTQKADTAALRTELQRVKKSAADYCNKISVIESDLAGKEGECVALRSRVKELETCLRAQKKSIDACCSQLSEERQWRKASMNCLQEELSLAKETAGLVSIVPKKKNNSAANKSKNKFSQRIISTSTQNKLEEITTDEGRNRPQSAPPHQFTENTSEESLVDEIQESCEEDSGSDYAVDTIVEARKRGKGCEKEWSLDITAVSALLSRQRT
jgi:hypothetical protein